MLRRAAVLSAVLLLAACSGSSAKGEPVPVNKIAEGNVEGVSDLQIAVAVTSSDKWWTEWRTIHIGDDPLAAPPLIDFSKQHVVIVGSHLGKGSYVMTVPGITVSGNTAHVDLQVQNATGCPNAGDDVLPFQAYTVPVAVKKVSISEHDTSVNCH